MGELGAGGERGGEGGGTYLRALLMSYYGSSY